MRGEYPCTYEKACNVLYAVNVLAWTQTKTAIELGLNVGTVSLVVNGKRFPEAVPVPKHANENKR